MLAACWDICWGLHPCKGFFSWTMLSHSRVASHVLHGRPEHQRPLPKIVNCVAFDTLAWVIALLPLCPTGLSVTYPSTFHGKVQTPPCKVQFRRGRKGKDDLNRSRLPLFRQGGLTVGLTTRLSAKRDQGGFILIGRFVEAIRETSIRRNLSIPLLR